MSDPVPFRAAGRQLSSFIAGFLEFTDGLTSPEIFRKWAAISAIGAALERRAHISSQSKPLYPNLYVFLCGPPGTGKSNAFHVAENLFRSLTTHHMAPVDLTKAAFIDVLQAATRTNQQSNTLHHALYVAVGELGALLPGYDAAFMNTLTYFYDGQGFEEQRRSKDPQGRMEYPVINILAGTTPGFLNNMLPIGAWDQGFLARVIIVYSDEIVKRKLNLLDENVHVDTVLENALKHDLNSIGAIGCKMQFTPPAAAAVENWYAAEGTVTNEPPSHPRLQHYNTRRLVHLLKLCMIAAADRGVTTIDLYDFHSAHGWLVEVESKMPDVFKAMTSGGESQVITECHHFLKIKFAKEGNPIPVHMVFGFLQQRLPPHSVERSFQVMMRCGMMIERNGGLVPVDTTLL